MGRFIVRYQVIGEGEHKILIDVEGTTTVTSGVRNAATVAVDEKIDARKDFVILDVLPNDQSPLDG
jgi:hypothetical protein